MSSGPPQVSFSADVRLLSFWADRTGLLLPASAEALGTPYARAHRWLLALKNALVAQHAWREAAQGADGRMLFAIEMQQRTSSGVPRSPPLTLMLPKHPSSFFSPDRKLQWQMTFHATTFFTLRHSCPPIQDILYLLQCLIPGMLVIAKVEDIPREAVYTTSRALPPADWVSAHQDMLVDIFGAQHFRQIFRAASNDRMAYHVDTQRR